MDEHAQDPPHLPLTERVINETVRLRPPGWFFTTSVVTADTYLGGYPLPAGTSVTYRPYVIHHRPDLDRDSEVVTPDRWALPPPSRRATPSSPSPRATASATPQHDRGHPRARDHRRPVAPGTRVRPPGRLVAAVTLELRDLQRSAAS
ncbi:cytochrome P450 [Streptomyces sp. NPDC026092]|uniref:cytochrome P450 n=1 Tax=Streptomyces sp. NPDC026092 TaxID=3154797 RepID=UPI00340DE21C